VPRDYRNYNFTCPFCGGAAGVRLDAKLQNPDGSISDISCLTHSLPYCIEFEDAPDALAFIRSVRKELERRHKETN
jgi:hypothetical protein